jgi:hypothetical protein
VFRIGFCQPCAKVRGEVGEDFEGVGSDGTMRKRIDVVFGRLNRLSTLIFVILEMLRMSRPRRQSKSRR